MDPIIVSMPHATTGIPYDNPATLFTTPEDGIYRFTIFLVEEDTVNVLSDNVTAVIQPVPQPDGDVAWHVLATSVASPTDGQTVSHPIETLLWLKGGTAIPWCIHNTVDNGVENMGTFSLWLCVEEVIACPGF